MDHEVIQNLLSVRLPLSSTGADWHKYLVKVSDAEFNVSQTRLGNPEVFHPKLVARPSKDEGWFWSAGQRLAYLFFQNRVTGRDAVRTWDDLDRPVHHGTQH
jgi:hypothetical protein